MSDTSYAPQGDVNGRRDPADYSYEFALKLERDEEVYNDELREAISDAIDLLEDRMDQLDRDHENQETNDKRLLAKAAIDVLGEV